jgi:hypothetical protein
MTVSVVADVGFRAFVSVHVAAWRAASVIVPSAAQSPPMTLV